MNFRGAPKSAWRGLRQSDKSNLSFFHELRHRANSFFDRSFRIDAVLIVKIDGIDAQPAQACLARPFHIIGFAAHSAHGWIGGITDDAEFCSEKNPVALAFDRPPNQFFVLVWAVDIGGIEKIDAQIESAMNGGYRFVVVTAAVELRHAHATQAFRRYFDAAAS